MLSPCCLCLCVSPPYQLLNAWKKLYETWYVYHVTWAHFNGILNKSLPTVCVSLFACCQATARKERYRGNEYTRNSRGILGRVVFYVVRVVTKESRRLVLPRTCYIHSFHCVYSIFIWFILRKFKECFPGPVNSTVEINSCFTSKRVEYTGLHKRPKLDTLRHQFSQLPFDTKCDESRVSCLLFNEDFLELCMQLTVTFF
jgi:hypothetical protein